MTLIMENRNNSTPFTYSVTFSNSTATVSITTNITNSSMTLSFTGDRITNFTAGYPQLELDTSDSSMPHFRYINDSSIHFKDISGTWEAAATPSPTASPTSPTWPTWPTSPASVSQARQRHPYHFSVILFQPGSLSRQTVLGLVKCETAGKAPPSGYLF